MEDRKSPAVQSLENEQIARFDRPNRLDEGLQGTFPASDAVSAATTAIPIGTGGLSLGPAPASASDAPRVDEALESILEHRNDPYAAPKENAAAVRDEFDSLRYRAVDDIRGKIRSDPWRAVGIAAAIGFLFGVTR
jgi:ElaB/YqjD/DUF883 family membrane-anchored ribosome-binding protein